jgi:methyl-accepting chemotaxis protein
MKVSSIQTRLLLILLPFLIISFAVLTGISYYLSQQSLGRSVDETAMSIGTDYAHRVKATMQNLATQLADVAVMEPIRAGSNSAQIVATLAEAKTRIGHFDNVVYIRLDGSGIRNNGSTANFADRDYLKKLWRRRERMFPIP